MQTVNAGVMALRVLPERAAQVSGQGPPAVAIQRWLPLFQVVPSRSRAGRQAMS